MKHGLAAPDADTLDPGSGALLTIDYGAIRRNYRRLKGLAGDTETAAVVKADAYGCGIARAVPLLYAEGCRTFFTALLGEAILARRALDGAAASIYVLNGFAPGILDVMREHGLAPVLGSLPELSSWNAEAQAEDVRPAVHVDTGMSRLGLTIEEAVSAEGAAAIRAAKPALLMTHLACADTPDHPLTARQITDFSAVAARLPEIPTSLANSAATVSGLAVGTALARPGIALYGGAAVNGIENPMEPVVRLDARVIQTRSVQPGETVGYGATWTAKRETRLALVSLGYADGYPRLAGSRGAYAVLAGHRVPLAGRVSMDLIAIDVTDVPCKTGELIQMIGPDVTIDAVAGWAETIGYEVLTGLGRRFEYRHIDSEAD